jgi:hypothetical protein
VLALYVVIMIITNLKLRSILYVVIMIITYLKLRFHSTRTSSLHHSMWKTPQIGIPCFWLRARLQTSNAIYSRKRPALASNSQFKVFFDLRRQVTKLAIILHQIKVSRPISKLKSKLFSFFLFCLFCFFKSKSSFFGKRVEQCKHKSNLASTYSWLRFAQNTERERQKQKERERESER